MNHNFDFDQRQDEFDAMIDAYDLEPNELVTEASEERIAATVRRCFTKPITEPLALRKSWIKRRHVRGRANVHKLIIGARS